MLHWQQEVTLCIQIFDAQCIHGFHPGDPCHFGCCLLVTEYLICPCFVDLGAFLGQSHGKGAQIELQILTDLFLTHQVSMVRLRRTEALTLVYFPSPDRNKPTRLRIHYRYLPQNALNLLNLGILFRRRCRFNVAYHSGNLLV